MRSRLPSLASRWARPAAIAAVVEVIAIGGTALGPSHRGGRPFDLVALPLIVLAAGATAFARRWPVPSLTVALVCTVAYFGLGYPIDSSFFLGLAVTAYLSGSAGGRRRAAIFAALTVALFAAAPLAGRTREGIQNGLGEAVIVIAALVAGQVAAEWRARADRQAAQARDEESMRRLAEERLRIARELHDVVSHSIAMINVQAGAAVHVMDERPEEARAALVAIKAVSRDALRDLRGILGLLRQTDDAEPRSPAAGLDQVPELAENVRRAGVPVAVSVEAGGTALPASIDLAAFRVIQEALTNVVRHAPGAAASVTVHRRPGSLLVEVVDDGRATAAGGGDGRGGAGHGLAGMRERVRAAGGSVEAGPRPDGGFAVRASLPLEVEPA
ncbi:MAG TPA: histidine kinase [Candidatus Dormibacteraeota bacterium]|nr:histidine kinase [Candidatus Dormibacteraeota bacterium]